MVQPSWRNFLTSRHCIWFRKPNKLLWWKLTMNWASTSGYYICLERMTQLLHVWRRGWSSNWCLYMNLGVNFWRWLKIILHKILRMAMQHRQMPLSKKQRMAFYVLPNSISTTHIVTYLIRVIRYLILKCMIFDLRQCLFLEGAWRMCWFN